MLCAKKQYGEVETPEHLVKMMLGMLPEYLFDPKNKNLKVMDVGCGKGVFSRHVTRKLQCAGFSSISNCLHAIEIQESKVDLCNMDPCNQAKVIHGNFVDSNLET